jgi:hypothetical protein
MIENTPLHVGTRQMQAHVDAQPLHGAGEFQAAFLRRPARAPSDVHPTRVQRGAHALDTINQIVSTDGRLGWEDFKGVERWPDGGDGGSGIRLCC